MDTVLAELDVMNEHLTGLDTVFIGGGTPTTLADRELKRLGEAIASVVGVGRRPVEWSVEVNPAVCSLAQLETLIDAGVNRFSFGVQSFDSEMLARLGRRAPSRGQLNRLLAGLVANNVNNFSVDLIYGIPGQTLGGWVDDVKRACDLGIRHLSTYELTMEEGSRLAAANGLVVDDDLAVAMWRRAEAVVSEWGLQRYEVSNFAMPGWECRHNADIWHGATYLGMGPAASSFEGRRRWVEPANFREWLAGAPAVRDDISWEHRLTEVFAFGLRTVAGWAGGEFLERMGVAVPVSCVRVCRELAGEGYLLGNGYDAWRPTEKGVLFSDSVVTRLLSPSPDHC